MINAKITPAKVKYNPFLNIVVLGRNIQNDEITKNNNEQLQVFYAFNF